MRDILADIGNDLVSWSGNMSETKDIEPKISMLIDCGKYDGKFLVDDPKIKQENLFDNVLLGIQRSSIDKPTLLFLDDLQWADVTTLNLLHYLARNIKQNRILVLGTYRPEDIIQSRDGVAHHRRDPDRQEDEGRERRVLDGVPTRAVNQAD